MTKVFIPNSVVNFFATENIETSWAYSDTIQDKQHLIFNDLKNFINSLSKDLVENVMCDPMFKFMCRSSDKKTQEKHARKELACRLIDEEINMRKRSILCGIWEKTVPPPYDHHDLEGVRFDKNYLVDLAELEINFARLKRGNSVFHVLPSLPQRNSMYWAIPNLIKLRNSAQVSVRLDPFMVQPIEGYKEVCYKMLVYGVPLDWDDIANLSEARHARWMPHPLNTSGVKFTDVVWVPRSDGVHFICEEVPDAEWAAKRGSRYVHAIYDPSSADFNHVDGAIRYYLDSELIERHSFHVRNGGKCGIRVKVFQIDGEIARDTWCDLVVSYFVWNEDVRNYFSTAEL
ncbi:MAG: hypothetical protein CVU89_17455 [Firmicutes bacterium HGW-Firmicutes-14]|jgi:hypothetical protein|nr:MAG: hypothetical protein CVU89_17455 [Firmicutes bacterium HGW-Firmicutes-14]